MPIITPQILKQIAEELDMGMVCYFHKVTGELEIYPDENHNPGFDDECWIDVMDKVSENRDDYIECEPMSSRESFRVMENFIGQIGHIPTRNKFIDVISRKRPFAHFKDMLEDYPELLKQWYAFKEEAYIEYVKALIDAANVDEEEKL
ncbi:UPF0158 family protein [Mucilaginibacter flavidus]|uniref:UPF0158 family protein n=1 Tax=Mucilaginibacter flavidus TaxID=2949309 RepID=UPI002093BD6F|nr:UPF0158 family protein [Mucilaginibacter flavidus]MCO5946092.1 UPF0158 family protein [Mucilaginibacter flavidus]